MRWLWISVIIVAVCVLGCGSSEPVIKDTLGEPSQFYVVTMSTPATSGDEGSVRGFAMVPYSSLKFVVQKGGMYEATFSIDARLYLGDKEVAYATVENVHITIPTREAISDPLNVSAQEFGFTGTPMTYQLRVDLVDHNRPEIISRVEKSVLMRAMFPADLEVSEPIVIETYKDETETAPASIFPANYGFIHNDSVRFIAIAYLPEKISYPTSITFHYEVYGEGFYAVANGASDPISCTKPWSYYVCDFLINNNVPAGTYTISVYAELESGEKSWNATSQFAFAPFIPRTSEEWDLAADDLEYVFDARERGDVCERVREATTADEKRLIFGSFWEGRGKSSQHGRGMMNTFLYRAQHARVRFGYPWNDDRMRIYVLFGIPARIEKTDSKSLRSSSMFATETWYYETSDNYRIFFFVEDRWGNYSLRTGEKFIDW